MNSVVELLCQDEVEQGMLAQAFAVYFNPRVPLLVLTEAYGTIVYWYAIAGILRRQAEEEAEEDEYRDAERILGAAEKFLDKSLMVTMSTNKELRYQI